MSIPTQTNQNIRINRRAVQSFDNPIKLAFDKLSAEKKLELLKNHYSRKQLLSIDESILKSNPDKHFVWINMNKLQMNGMWHEEGYKLYRANEDKESMQKENFGVASDNFIHRNEMVLAYLPMEEYLEREMEKMVAREGRDVTDVITKNDAMVGFHPHGKETKETIRIPAQQSQ